MRPLALRSAGKSGANASVVRHAGRRSGRAYETPVVVAAEGEGFVIALPYGPKTDWLRNVLAAGGATIVTDGHSYEVDRPEVVSMADVTSQFRAKEQRMHRRFGVGSALRLHRLGT
ncbi:MAG TPA: nitroreductase family deazaflavin-dependent oxidoreductase [Acidimicrobiales bacterium]|nr:nitroreductase family deazaflavin-dependent oxidoreductase [Acidimicrobiales bacterium]